MKDGIFQVTSIEQWNRHVKEQLCVDTVAGFDCQRFCVDVWVGLCVNMSVGMLGYMSL